MAIDPERDPSLNQNVQLHVCPECDGELVQPLRWDQGPRRGTWRLQRRCPECEWTGVGIFPERLIEEYDIKLDDGAEKLSNQLEEMERENMAEAAGVMTTALEADLIGPDDFLPRRI